MSEVESRRIAAFLAVAFGVAWATAAVIYATGGLVDSPRVLGPLTFASVLLPTAYMFSPAIGNVAARLATGEGRDGLALRPEPKAHLRTYAVVWVGPFLLTVLGAAVYFLAFPSTYDPSMAAYRGALAAAGATDVDPTVLVAVQVVAALTVAPLLNGLFAFGEEFGWRAYLLPKLLPLGVRRATVLSGAIWGAWHWPLIAMGYEYGFAYVGFPWTGLLVFPVFTVAVGTVLAWATLREGSVWPAAVGHGAVNAIAPVAAIFVRGNPNPLLGPLPVGLLAGLPWVVVAVYLLVRTPEFEPDGGVA